MKTTLKAEVEMWKVHAFAELAVWESRPDLARLCSAASTNGELALAVVDRVLPGLSETARKNILQSLRRQRLLDDRHQLTKLGRACAATGNAPAWELGVYKFLVGIHPVVGSHVLGFARAEIDNRDKDFDSLEPLPPWFAPDPERMWQSVVGESERFSVCALQPLRGKEAFCRVEEMESGRLVWDIDLDSGRNTWRIEGSLGDGKAFRSTPASHPEAGLTQLMERWEPRWSRASRRVLIPYDGGARDGGQDDFVRTYTYPNVQVPGVAVFEKVVVEAVPVGPITDAAARDWAAALATARVAAADAHVHAAEWAGIWQQVVRGTPLEAGAGPAPSQTSLLETAKSRLGLRTRWLLCAAFDLATE